MSLHLLALLSMTTTVRLKLFAESSIADAHLAAYFTDLRTQFHLLENKCNLLLGKPTFFHYMPVVP